MPPSALGTFALLLSYRLCEGGRLKKKRVLEDALYYSELLHEATGRKGGMCEGHSG